MKKHTNLFNTAVLLMMLSLPLLSFAGKEDDSEKKKNISKTYDVTAKR